MFILLTTIFLLFVFGIVEKWRHQQRLRQIPIRIHVNGTRGKSLLTRMLVDLFSQAGYSVAARVTGEKPQAFQTGPGWQIWPRFAPARIKEVARFIRQISTTPPRVLVLENMALAPENLFAAERFLVQATLSVFTNFRTDHQEVWGKNPVSALRHALPRRATLLVTADDLRLLDPNQLKQLEINLITPPAPVTPESAEFAVFESQFQLVRAIAAHYQLPNTVLEATLAAWRQKLLPNQWLIPIRLHPEPQTLVNLFTCNDVPSATLILQNLEQQQMLSRPCDVLILSRGDRPLRTFAFLNELLPQLDVRTMILAGQFPRLTVRRWLRKNKPGFRVCLRPGKIQPARLLACCSSDSAFVLGLGNFVGSGEKILEYLKTENYDN
jgi:hypothetical protein